MIPAFPKPSQVKKKPEAVRVYRDGREVCNLNCKAGMDEYINRKRKMWERDNKRCCLESLIPTCPGKLRWDEATFEHDEGRGHDGGHRDDRIEKPNPETGKMEPINGVSHPQCNIAKGSRRRSVMLQDIVP